MIRLLGLIAAGGAVGSVSRYLLQQLVARHFTHPFPLGTLLVNVLGCLLIGVLYEAAERGALLSPALLLLLTTGFCGGFTTFSTFSFETVALLTEGRFAFAALYVAGSLLLGLAAAFGGVLLARAL